MTVPPKNPATPDLQAGFNRAAQNISDEFTQFRTFMETNPFMKELKEKISAGAPAAEIGQFVLEKIESLIGMGPTSPASSTSAATVTTVTPAPAAPSPNA